MKISSLSMLNILTILPLWAASSSSHEHEVTQSRPHIPAFLHHIGVRPERITLSSSGYTRQRTDLYDQTIARIDHAQRECLTPIIDMHRRLANPENNLNDLVERYLLISYCIQKLFSTQSTSMSSSSLSSTPALESFRQIVAGIDENYWRAYCWEFLDEQPKSTDRRHKTVSAERETFTSLIHDLRQFREQSTTDDESSAHALGAAIEELCSARRKQLAQERAYVQEQVIRGIATMRTLKDEASRGELAPSVPADHHTRCRQQ